MVEILDLFETHLTVSDLDRSVAFYRDVLGLPLATRIPERDVAFFWVGGHGKALLGLWAGGAGPQRMTLHTAFRVRVEDVLAAMETLRAAGIAPLDLAGRPTGEPVVLAWMPAVSIYFQDPDGNLLEYIAMLPGEGKPELGVMGWRAWGELGM